MKYITPEIELVTLGGMDIITTSFGELEELPGGSETPGIGIGGSRWGW